MSKYPSEPKKSCVDDEDYEIVSFEDFCDKSPGSKTDLLTLNDNINYRLCFEKEKTSEFAQGEPSAEIHSETSLDGSTIKNKLSGPFAPFGRSNVKTGRGSLFGGVIPKPRNDGESSREHRYQRFSGDRTIFQRIWDNLPGFGSGMLGVALVCGLCVAAWWAVGGAVGGAWGEEHYRKLWERAHPDNIKTPLSPIPFEKVPEGYRYHDHNNLSTKNKNISTELRKKEAYKKSYSDMTPEMQTEVCGLVEENMRFDCFPSKEASEEGCVKRGCCWKASSAPNTAPYCYYPPHYNPYNFVNMTENKHGMTFYYTLARPSGYPDDFALLKMDVRYLSDDVLQIKISDAEHKRFEVPVPQIPMVPGPITNMKYRVQLDSGSVGFKVIRNADNVTIVNTQDVGAMILSNKFLQISTILPTNNVFGFGEHRDRFKRDMNWKTYTMFNRDVPPTDNTNLYGTHPFYMAVENEGNSHGMLLLNSNAMDVVFQPTPALTLRTLGGVLNLFIMLGPSPREVVAQYTGLIGRPFMPPYWSLGFHLCKFGYGDLNTTRKVWQTNREAGIPFDVIWNDIDYMNNFNDFTYDPVKYVGLPDFIRKVHMKGMRYVILIDPGISAAEKPGTYPPYERGIQYDIFVKNGTNQPFIGKVWNTVSTVYPDFTHPNSTAYWLEQMDAYHNKVPYDGAWIDMNEPSNFLDGPIYGYCEPEDLPYKPAFITSVGLRHKTLCTDAKHYIGAHYDVHNLYGLTEAIATHFALMEIRGRRPFIISRSSFPGLGHYAGHWSGDIFSTWDDMRMSISDLLSFSLFGVPMMGSDICGFNGNTTVELCKRWMQLGAFYPFSRNHNDIAAIPQDPVSLGPIVVDASIDALRLRYRLLPYYYTLFWRAHVYGETVARPMFFEFPTDLTVRNIDYQFLIGPHVMITPILTEGANNTRAYFPGPHKWFNLRDGTFISYENWFNVNEFQTVSIRGGGIIPLQDPPFRGPVTTSNTRSGPFQLLVAPDITDNGRGELYWDDGESLNSYEERKYSHIEFTLKKYELQSNVIWWGYGVPLMNNITIIGQSYPVGSVYLNGDLCQKPHCEYNFVGKTKTLYIYGISLSLDKPFNVKWSTDYPPEVKHSTKKVVSNFGFGVG